MTIDHEALRAVAERYGLGADRRDKDMWRAVLARDIVISGPGFEITGLEANLGSIDHLAAQFKATRHLVHDMDVTITGDTASGETRSTAEHRMADPAGGGGDVLLVWAIRYQDQWRRAEAGWQFTRRHLIVDWQELRPVHDAAG
jgi:hypothetical protein